MTADRPLAATVPWSTAARVAVTMDDWQLPDLGGRPLCAETDPDLFFPEKGGEGVGAAKRICQKCPVIAACLEWALDNNERFGIWGGLSERQREQLVRKRRPRQITHGTEGGYALHIRRKETPCNSCRSAMTIKRAERAAS